MKHLFSHFTSLAIVALFSVFSISACTSKRSYDYKSPKEAIADCKRELYRLKSLQSVDIDELHSILTDWTTRRDTIYNRLKQEEDTAYLETYASNFFALTDSVNNEIKRLSLSREWSIDEIYFLRLRNTQRRNTIANKSSYIKASDFFDSLDRNEIKTSQNYSSEQYVDFLQQTDSIKTEKDFLSFLAKEDYCFRNLLNHLTEVSGEELIQLTELTDQLLNSYVASINNQLPIDDIKRVETYLIMRVNRRVIQNAIACRNMVYVGTRLTKEQVNRFWWMIIQPFLSIDQDAINYLTAKQIKDLQLISVECPKLLHRIHKLGHINIDKDTENHIQSALSYFLMDAFLTSCLY